MRFATLGFASRWFLLLLLSAVTASAQSLSTAQINGNVRDEGGLPLPGVTVTLTQTGTGLTRTAVTSENGSYTVTNLPVGPYQLEAMLQGFRAYVQTGIVLQVNSNPTLNVTLSIGQVAETITVTGTAPLVETRNPGIGQVVTNQQVVELPLNGRQLTQLVLTAGLATGGPGAAAAPGAGPLNSGVRNYPTVTVAVAGGLSNGMNFILDGGTHTDPFNGLNLPLPFPDAMQEFKVETSALPAQYGHHSAAAINAVTKSGTNAVHGDAFEFMRDHRLNATNAFATSGPDGKRKDDGLHRDQFGGTLGGPVVRGKLFYFGGYQGTTVDVVPSTFFSFVPTADMLRGDFSAITSPACNAGRAIPLRAPFVNNTIDPSLFSPVALNVTKQLPTTSDPCGRVDYPRKQANNERMGIGRVDYQVNSNHTIFGRYEFARYHSDSDFDPANVLVYSIAPINARVHSTVLGDTYLLGPNTVSSFRATYNSSFIQKGPYAHYFDATQMGVKNIANMQPGFMRVAVSGGFTFGGTNAQESVDPTKTIQLTEDLSIIRGAHQFGIGADYIHSKLFAASLPNAPGLFTFTGAVTGLGLSDFLLGRTSTLQQGMAYTFHESSHYIGLYAQDSWKVARRLTVNAGLRWDPYQPYRDTEGVFSHFSFDQWNSGVRSKVYAKAPAGIIFEGDPGYPGNAIGTRQLADFAPRLSAAWDIKGDGLMTLRAAWGRFFDLPHLFFPFAVATTCPLACVLTVSGAQLDDPYATVVGGNPFPLVKNANMTFNQFANYITFPLDLKPPYADQSNVSFQRQLGSAWAVSANYVHSGGHRLPVGDNINPSVYGPGATTANSNQRRVLYLQNPTEGQYYGNIIALLPTGTSTFNGLLLTATHRATQGLTLSTNYTLSKCISDTVNYEIGMAGLNLVKPGDKAYDRGSCGASDRRHVVNVSTVYQLPHFANGALGVVANDWQVSAIVRAQSGNHFNVTTGVDNALTGQANQRPDQILSNPYLKQGSQWLNPAAFQPAPAGTYGNLADNALVAPGTFNTDLGITRSFRMGQRQLQFRGEVFNLFNNTQLNNPVAALNTSNFGAVTSAGDPRIIQLALKFVF